MRIEAVGVLRARRVAGSSGNGLGRQWSPRTGIPLLAFLLPSSTICGIVPLFLYLQETLWLHSSRHYLSAIVAMFNPLSSLSLTLLQFSLSSSLQSSCGLPLILAKPFIFSSLCYLNLYEIRLIIDQAN